MARQLRRIADTTEKQRTITIPKNKGNKGLGTRVIAPGQLVDFV
jgi:hypothetical protein